MAWVHELATAADWQGNIITLPRNILPQHLMDDYDYCHNCTHLV